MQITIDATKVAHELAMAEVCKHSFTTLYSIKSDQIRRVIESGKDEEYTTNSKFFSYWPSKQYDNNNKAWEHLRQLYRDKYDYYFEILTNMSYEKNTV